MKRLLLHLGYFALAASAFIAMAASGPSQAQTTAPAPSPTPTPYPVPSPTPTPIPCTVTRTQTVDPVTGKPVVTTTTTGDCSLQDLGVSDPALDGDGVLQETVTNDGTQPTSDTDNNFAATKTTTTTPAPSPTP